MSNLPIPGLHLSGVVRRRVGRSSKVFRTHPTTRAVESLPRFVYTSLWSTKDFRHLSPITVFFLRSNFLVGDGGEGGVGRVFRVAIVTLVTVHTFAPKLGECVDK